MLTQEQQQRLDALPAPLRAWCREDATVAMYVGRHVRGGLPLGRALAQLQRAMQYPWETWRRHHDSMVRDTVPLPDAPAGPYVTRPTTMRTRSWCAGRWQEGGCRAYGEVLRYLRPGDSGCARYCGDCVARGQGWPIEGREAGE